MDSAAWFAGRFAPIFANQATPSNGPVNVALDWSNMEDAFKTIDCDRWSDLPRKIEDLDKDIKNRVIPTQTSSSKKWDLIRIELWEDTGRIIAFPAEEKFTSVP